MALRLFSRGKAQEKEPSEERRKSSRSVAAPGPRKRRKTVDYEHAPKVELNEDPLFQLLQQGRYQVIIRDQANWSSHPEFKDILAEAQEKLEARLSLVPASLAAIGRTLSNDAGGEEDEYDIAPFMLNIHATTNAEYQHFVDAGGYEALEYWPEDIWPHLIEFKDLTDQPGPALWRDGRHDVRYANHPVVGVSWFEAQAYALWIGQRLPADVEWQAAASWSIKSSADIHRRFPWGDAMDNTRCNIWSSRRGGTVAVDEYPSGAAPNGVLQLVGNVWEWTVGEYAITDDSGRPVLGEMIMQVVRGGAFDTYFETQATSLFRSGLIALARTHDAGFRCALDLSQVCWLSSE